MTPNFFGISSTSNSLSESSKNFKKIYRVENFRANVLNILELLTVGNIYRLHALKFIRAWHKGVLPELFNRFFQYASNVHNYNTRYAAKQNPHKFRVKTNTGKQMISFMAIDLWQELPYKFKDLNQFAFSKSVKTIFYLSNIKPKFPQMKRALIQVILNLVIRPSTPSFFFNVYSNKVEANSITSGFFLVSRH